jgi:hypothetical protein
MIKVDKQELNRKGHLENYLMDVDEAFIYRRMTGPITVFFL